MVKGSMKGARAAATRRARPPEESGRRLQVTVREVLELVLALGLIAGLAAGVHLLRDPAVLPVRVVHVEGELRHVKPAQLRAAVLEGLRGNFFTVDLERLEAAVAALPWVARVRVRREWPLALRVFVEEQVAVARWGREALLNPYGEVFVPERLDEAGVRGLPVLYGPPGQSARVLAAWGRLSERLGAVGLRPVALYLDERRAWRAWLEGRIEVAFGRVDFDRRLQRLVRVWPRVLAAQAGRIERLDLRYSNGLAVQWRRARESGRGPSPSGEETRRT